MEIPFQNSTLKVSTFAFVLSLSSGRGKGTGAEKNTDKKKVKNTIIISKFLHISIHATSNIKKGQL